tara:strand:- start:45 stop:581 length:537 start_codon:yes stop_codon:yes gene_type:complete
MTQKLILLISLIFIISCSGKDNKSRCQDNFIENFRNFDVEVTSRELSRLKFPIFQEALIELGEYRLGEVLKEDEEYSGLSSNKSKLDYLYAVGVLEGGFANMEFDVDSLTVTLTEASALEVVTNFYELSALDSILLDRGKIQNNYIGFWGDEIIVKIVNDGFKEMSQEIATYKCREVY